MDCDDPQAGCGSLSTPAFDGSTLYVGAGSPNPDAFNLGSVYAFTPGGDQLWIANLDDVVLAPVTVANGLVFVSTVTRLVVLDAATGDKLWDDGGVGPLYAQPVVLDGTVYAPYVNGSLVAYRLPAHPSDSNIHRPKHQSKP